MEGMRTSKAEHRKSSLVIFLIRPLLILIAFSPAVYLLNASLAYGINGYSFVKTWGSQGTAENQFSTPTGVATDTSGNVYVLDSGNNRIQKFSSNGTFIAKWGLQGTADGQFNNPTGIAVDPLGNVYMADPQNDRIQKFSSDGTFITKWGGHIGSLFDGDTNNPPLIFPSSPGIAVDPSGNVYVADTLEHKIVKFSTDGTWISDLGSNGIGDGQFSFPSSLSTDSAGNLYVLDSANHRIQVFTGDGKFITKWGSQGSGDGQFGGKSSAITVDRGGNVYVADSGNNRIQKFDSTGKFITKWGSQGSDDGQFAAPSGVAVDPSGNVYVVDSHNNRVQLFSIARPVHTSS
jgi:tripartite motif-containing protein 71